MFFLCLEIYFLQKKTDFFGAAFIEKRTNFMYFLNKSVKNQSVTTLQLLWRGLYVCMGYYIGVFYTYIQAAGLILLYFLYTVIME